MRQETAQRSFYVTDTMRRVKRRLVEFFAAIRFCRLIFTKRSMEGTFVSTKRRFKVLMA